MSHMPEKNPETWLIVMAWLSQHSPTIYAAAASAAMAVLRIIYGGGTRRQALLEATICMLLTTSLISVLEYFGLPSSLATPAGIWTGFLGVKKIADIADRFTDFKLPKRQE
jgi:lambda family phage holin